MNSTINKPEQLSSTINKLEQSLMEDMVRDISSVNDPVEQFRAIERYKAFVEPRCARLESESWHLQLKD